MSDFSKWAESKVYTEDDGYASAELAWNHQQKEIDRLHKKIERLQKLIEDHKNE